MFAQKADKRRKYEAFHYNLSRNSVGISDALKKNHLPKNDDYKDFFAEPVFSPFNLSNLRVNDETENPTETNNAKQGKNS